MFLTAFVLALRVAATSRNSMLEDFADATPTLQDVLAQIGQATKPITAAKAGVAVTAAPVTSVKAAVSNLKNKASWVQYFESRDFWFPNAYSIITIVFLVAAGIAVF
jgi:phosphoglycolate phosphatase-like HAD superfamily hydrolase